MVRRILVAVCAVIVCFAASIQGADITWDGGGGDNNWSTGANWSTDSVPGSSDNVIFDNTSSKDCTIDSSVTVEDFTISSGYGGTISGGSSTIDINGDLLQAGGTFTSTSGTLDISENWTISSGTFNHNSGTVEISTPASSIDIGSTTLNNLVFDMSSYSLSLGGDIDVDGSLTVTYIGGMTGGDIQVAGNVTTTDSSFSSSDDSCIDFNGGDAQTLDANGGTGQLCGVKINKSGESTLTISDTITINGGGWTYSSGTVDATTNDSTIGFAASYMTIDSSGMSFDNVEWNASTYTHTIDSTMTVEGDLTITAIGALNGSNIEVKGHLSSTDSIVSGTSTIKINGTSGQTISGGGEFPSIEVDKSGTLTYGSDFSVRGDYTHTAGSLSAGTYKLTLRSSGTTFTTGGVSYGALGIDLTYSYSNLTISGTATVTDHLYLTKGKFSGTINAGSDITVGTDFTGGDGTGTLKVTPGGTRTVTTTGSGHVNDVELDMGTYGLTTSGDLDVNGNLTITAVGSLSGNNIKVSGDVVVTDTGFSSPTSKSYIEFDGSGNQELYVNKTGGTGELCGVKIDKATGTLTIYDTLTIRGGGWTWAQGTVDAGTSTVKFVTSTLTIDSGSMSFNDVIFDGTTFGHTITGTMNVGGDLTITIIGSLNTGTIAVSGDITSNDTAVSGNATVQAAGTGNQNISAPSSGMFPNFEINKTSGTATLTSDIIVNGDYTYTQGTFDANSKKLTLTGHDSIFTPGPGSGETTISYYDLDIDQTYTNSEVAVINGSRAKVTNNLDLTKGRLYSGTIKVDGSSGTVTVGADFDGSGDDGTGEVEFSGTGSPTITGSSGLFPDVEINKSSGTVTQGSDIKVEGDFTVSGTGGTFDTSTYQLELTEDFTNTASEVASATFTSSGTVKLAGTSGEVPETQTITSGTLENEGGSASTFNNLTIDSETIIKLADGMDVNGNITYTDSESIDLNSQTLELEGNITVSGSAYPNFSGGTVKLDDGTAQTLTGTMKFGTLQCTESGETITFSAGNIFSFGTLTLTGTNGSEVELRSSSSGTQYYFDVGTESFSYVDFKDCSACKSDHTLDATDNCIDTDDNNDNIDFGETGPVLDLDPDQEWFYSADSPLTITITVTEGTAEEIWYTTDGSIPSDTNEEADQYDSENKPTISDDTAFKARAKNSSDIWGPIVSRCYEKVEASDCYARITYGDGALLFLSDLRRFEGQTWWAGSDGIVDEMGGDDVHTSDYDDDITWSCTGGTITGGSEYAVYKEDGDPATSYSVTADIGGNQYTSETKSGNTKEKIECCEWRCPDKGECECRWVEYTIKEGQTAAEAREEHCKPEDPCYGNCEKPCINETFDAVHNRAGGLAGGESDKSNSASHLLVHDSGYYDSSIDIYGYCIRNIFQDTVRELADDNVILSLAFMRATKRYDKSGSDYIPYRNPLGVWYGVLEKVSGEFIYTGKSGYKRTFEAVSGTEYYRLKEMEDPEGNKITPYYEDSAWKMTRVEYESGLKYDFLYDSNDRVTRMTADMNGTTRNWDYLYDGTPYLTKTSIDSTTEKLELSWDSVGNITQMTFADDKSIKGEYDTQWRLTKFKDTADTSYSQEWEYVYKDDAKIIKQTDPSGLASWVKKTHNLIKTYSNGYTEGETDVETFAYEYDSQYRRTKTTQHLNDTEDLVKIYYWDDNRNLTKIVKDPDGLNLVTEYYFDSNDNRTKEVIDPDGLALTTTWSYDSDYNVTKKIKDPDGLALPTIYDYDADGMLVTKTFPDDSFITYEYDSDFRLTRTTDEEDNPTDYLYDNWGNLTSDEDPNDNATTFEYDGLDRVTRATDAETKYSQYKYNSIGLLTKEIDPNLNETIYYYDDTRRITKITGESGGGCAGCGGGSGEEGDYYRDSAGKVTKFVDPIGKATYYEYDARGLVTKVTWDYDYGSGGIEAETITYYDTAGRVTKTVDAEGRYTSYEYDKLGRRTKVNRELDEGEVSTTHEYDLAGRLTKTTDPLNHSTSYYYDAGGRQTKVIDAENTETAYFYDDRGRVTRTTKDAGAGGMQIPTKNMFDKTGRMTKIVQDEDGLDITTAYDYDPAGNLLTVTDPNLDTTVYFYDNVNRRVTMIQDPSNLALTKTYEYDANGNVTRETDAEGIVTDYEYCSKNLVTKQIVDSGIGTLNLATVYDVCAMKKITKIIDPEGKVTRYQYDGLYRLTKETDDYGTGTELNIATSYYYDKVGNRTRIEDNNSKETSLEFDDLYRQTKITFTDSTAKAFEYDDGGNLTKETDQENKGKTFLYDKMDRLTKVTDDSGGLDIDIIKYHDAIGRLTRIEDDKGNTTDYLYDNNSRMTLKTFTDNETIAYEYDDVGNRTEKTDQEGNIFTYYYDTVDRLTKTSIDTSASSMNGTTEQTYEYDDIGRMTKATDNNDSGDGDDGVTEWCYDNAGRVTRESQTVGINASAKTTRSVDRMYDKAGNRTKITYPSADYAELDHDSAHRLTRVYDGTTALAAYEYDSIGLVTKKTLGTSTTVALEVYHDDVYNITKYYWDKSSARLLEFRYGYDNAGNKNYEENLHDSDKSQYYYYDKVYRLTSYDEGTLNGEKTAISSVTYYQDWELDGVYNWEKFYDNSGTSKDHTVNNMNEYTEIDGTSQTHDDNGNLTDDGPFTYEYDALNRLIKVIRDSDSAVMGEYAYDTLDRRIYRKADEDQSGSQETELYYVYDGKQVIEERNYDANEYVKRDYWYGIGIDEPVYGRSDNNDNNDFDDSNEKFYYTHNTLPSICALLDTSGDIIERYEYKAYGSPTIYTGDGGDSDWWDGDETTGSLTGNYYLFAGRRYDPETDLMYNRMRMYSPDRGRFITRDRIGDMLSGPERVNLYSYSLNNPVNLSDPSGGCNGETSKIVNVFDVKKCECCCLQNIEISEPKIKGADEEGKDEGKGGWAQATFTVKFNWEVKKLEKGKTSPAHNCLDRILWWEHEVEPSGKRHKWSGRDVLMKVMGDTFLKVESYTANSSITLRDSPGLHRTEKSYKNIKKQNIKFQFSMPEEGECRELCKKTTHKEKRRILSKFEVGDSKKIISTEWIPYE